jgi:hypothetical protein
VAFAAQDLEVKAWFPENPTNEFVPGKSSKAIFGVHNAGSDGFNVTYATASLALPYEPSTSVFNFTSQVGSAAHWNGCRERAAASCL